MAGAPVRPHKTNQAANWAAAGRDYEKFSEDIGDAIVHCVRRLAPTPGDSVLDIATGTGWGARLLARRGAKVSGIDFGDDLITAANELASTEGLAIDFRTADAEALPFEDNSFDAVMSTFGVIFVEHPEIAAQEIARVCRPGGRVALTSWPAGGSVAELVQQVFAPLRPTPPDPAPPSQFLWGDRRRVGELLGDAFDLKFENGCSILREPSSEEIWNMWATSHGLTVKLLQNLPTDRATQLSRDFIAFHDQFRTEIGIAMPRDYLLTIGVRHA
ncbi:MAG: class I SAM-dependent methyltransferase [Rhodospirillaceae bacterium]|jgi:SAM-dependent methyltransferase|nr:class I SAM-dependent methyltransferase [Rhodospirillaceae bacterium]MBT6137525.1 class I SAM-dependent methyltransferase [Rhodospirillaceae bacterium]